MRMLSDCFTPGLYLYTFQKRARQENLSVSLMITESNIKECMLQSLKRRLGNTRPIIGSDLKLIADRWEDVRHEMIKINESLVIWPENYYGALKNYERDLKMFYEIEVFHSAFARVSEWYGISPERTRQIVNKWRRKFTHPSRRQYLPPNSPECYVLREMLKERTERQAYYMACKWGKSKFPVPQKSVDREV